MSTGSDRREKDVYVVKLVYIVNNLFSYICGGNARLPNISLLTPLELEPELAWFHEFHGKTLEGLFEPLVYFSNTGGGTGDLFFSTQPLSLHCRAYSRSEQTDTAHITIPLQLDSFQQTCSKKLCHCNHTICSVFKRVKRRRISLHYQNHLFCPKCCMLSML